MASQAPARDADVAETCDASPVAAPLGEPSAQSQDNARAHGTVDNKTSSPGMSGPQSVANDHRFNAGHQSHVAHLSTLAASLLL